MELVGAVVAEVGAEVVGAGVVGPFVGTFVVVVGVLEGFAVSGVGEDEGDEGADVVVVGAPEGFDEFVSCNSLLPCPSPLLSSPPFAIFPVLSAPHKALLNLTLTTFKIENAQQS